MFKFREICVTEVVLLSVFRKKSFQITEPLYLKDFIP